MEIDRTPDDFDSLVTFDIETTHYDATKGETVAIGIGHHQPGTPGTDATYETLVRGDVDDEAELIHLGLDRIANSGADALVSYHGIGFDMDFLEQRASILNASFEAPALHDPGPHVDVFASRDELVTSRYDRPSLEDCLASYSQPVPKTVWNGAELDNTRFGEEYGLVNDFLREHTTITAREWAMARLCQDFETETGVRMTFIGENLPTLVPFMTDTYTPQAVNQAKRSFNEKVQTAANTLLYGACCGFYSLEELDEILQQARETAEFFHEVEAGEGLPESEEADERVAESMRSVWDASAAISADVGDDREGDDER